jgi:hypothetical protein
VKNQKLAERYELLRAEGVWRKELKNSQILMVVRNLKDNFFQREGFPNQPIPRKKVMD